MAYQTKRRLRRDLDAVRIERDEARAALAKQAEAHDVHTRQLGQQMAERDERIAFLDKRHREQNELIDWFNNQCYRLECRVDRFASAWRSARARASRERTLNNDLLDELADHAPSVQVTAPETVP